MGKFTTKPYPRYIIILSAVIISGLTLMLAVDQVRGRRSILEEIQAEALAASPAQKATAPA